MNTELQRLFFEEVKKKFAFLLPRFKGPFSRLDEKTGIFYVLFMGTNLAIEFILNERDEDIACKVLRVIEGQPTSHYAVDPYGRRVRGELANLLIMHGIRSKLFSRVTGLPLRDQIPIVLDDYARMLQKYGQLVLDDNPQFLDTL